MKISHRATEWQQNHKPFAKKITRVHPTFGMAEHVDFIDEVYKIGAVTGCTYGTVKSEKISDVHLSWHDKHDYGNEIAVIGAPDTKFSWLGDSGAAVFDGGGLWLGLVYGGQTKLSCSQPLSYIIPANAILQDIKEFSGGKWEVRVKE